MSEFPEADKWSEVAADAAVVRDFLDWANAHCLWLCTHAGEHSFAPTQKTRQDLIYEFFEIDGKKLDAERREMLRRMRERDKR